MNTSVNGRPAHKEELGMTRRKKVSPARIPREDDSVLLRSAETIGRVIGALQRQLDGTRERLAHFVRDKEITRNDRIGSRPKATSARKNSAVKARTASSTAKKAPHTAKTKRAAKSPAARKGTKR